MTVSKGNQPERRTRRKKTRNPYRGTLKNMTALHTMRVGEGSIKPDEAVTKTIVLANGAEYEVSVRRTKASQDKTKGGWDFPPKAKIKAA